MNDHELLDEAGQFLFGPNYTVPLAKAVGVTDRTMRRWREGQNPVTFHAWMLIRNLLEHRAKTGGPLLKKVKAKL